MTVDFEVRCEDCALSQDVIRVGEELVVEVKSDRLAIRPGKAEAGALLALLTASWHCGWTVIQ